MKIVSYITFACLTLFYSCDEFQNFFPQSTFDSSYPIPNVSIEKEIGSYVIIKKDNDTLYLRISGSKNNNVISDILTGDTLFKGKVS